MSYFILQDVFFLIVLIGLSIPLGIYIYKVMTGQTVILSRLLSPAEGFLYRTMGIQTEEEMSPKKYALSVIAFSIIGLIFVWGLQMLQGSLPFNPEKIGGTSWGSGLQYGRELRLQYQLAGLFG